MSKDVTSKGEKLRWVRLKESYDGHAPGEKMEIEAKHVDDLVARGVAEEAKNPVKKYLQKALSKMTGKVGEQVSDAVKEELDKALKAVDEARKKANPLGLGAPLMMNDAGMRPRTIQDELGREVLVPDQPGVMPGIGMGKFLNAVRDCTISPTKENSKALYDLYGSKLMDGETGLRTKTALAESDGTTGGYLVPLEFSMRLLQLAVQPQIIRQRGAFVQPMGARSIRIPYLDVTTAQASGTTAFFGGFQIAWTEEASTKPESEPKFKQLELVAHELSALTLASNQLLADNAIGLDSFLSTMFPRAIGWYSDYAFFQGNGSGKPVGILNAPALIKVNRAGASGTFALADAITMLSKLLTTSMGSAFWVMSQTQIPNLYQIQDGASRNIILPNPQAPAGGAAQTPPMTLLGLPIIFSEKLPQKSGSQQTGDVILIDPQYYVIGDRMQLEIQSSIHYKFANAQTAWRCIARLDGQPWIDGAITLADGASTVSPFVALN